MRDLLSLQEGHPQGRRCLFQHHTRAGFPLGDNRCRRCRSKHRPCRQAHRCMYSPSTPPRRRWCSPRLSCSSVDPSHRLRHRQHPDPCRHHCPDPRREKRHSPPYRSTRCPHSTRGCKGRWPSRGNGRCHLARYVHYTYRAIDHPVSRHIDYVPTPQRGGHKPSSVCLR